jgi:L-2,4-diaminobutyrate decarboxylase
MTGPSMEATVARVCFPRGEPGGLITAGGAESTLLGLLLASKDARGAVVQAVCTRGAHPGVTRVLAQLGMPAPVVLDSFDELPATLATITTTTLVIASVGTADTGAVDPLREVGKTCRLRGTWLHVDATRESAAVFSDRLRYALDGLELADSVALQVTELDAGMLAVRSAEALTHVRPPLHPDVSEQFRACRPRLVAELDDRCDWTAELADAICTRPGLRLWQRPTLSTVVFRPRRATDESVTGLRERLHAAGYGDVGQASVDGQVWLTLTVTNQTNHLPLLDHVTDPRSLLGDESAPRMTPHPRMT